MHIKLDNPELLEKYLQNIRDLLYERRMELGLSQEELVELMGTHSSSYYSKIERGFPGVVPSFGYLFRSAESLKMPFEILFDVRPKPEIRALHLELVYNLLKANTPFSEILERFPYYSEEELTVLKKIIKP